MPWDRDLKGQDMTVGGLLNYMQRRLLYDAPATESLQIFRGFERFGKKVFSISPKAKDFELGGIEFYPLSS